MKAETLKLLRKAARAIDAAEDLLNRGDLDFAASRAYYAMFYVASALLSERGLQARKHGGAHALFGQAFALTGILDRKFHRWLLDAFDKRIQGDYGVDVVLTPEDVRLMIEQAREFLQAGSSYLGS